MTSYQTWDVITITEGLIPHQRFFFPTGYFIPHNSLYFLVSLLHFPLLSWFTFIAILLNHSWEFQILFILFCTANSTLSNPWRRAAPVYLCISKLVRVVQIKRCFYLTEASLRLCLWIEFLPLKMACPLLDHHKNLWWVTHNLLSGLLLLNWFLPNWFLTSCFLTGFSVSILPHPTLVLHMLEWDFSKMQFCWHQSPAWNSSVVTRILQNKLQIPWPGKHGPADLSASSVLTCPVLKPY